MAERKVVIFREHLLTKLYEVLSQYDAMAAELSEKWDDEFDITATDEGIGIHYDKETADPEMLMDISSVVGALGLLHFIIAKVSEDGVEAAVLEDTMSAQDDDTQAVWN